MRYYSDHQRVNAPDQHLPRHLFQLSRGLVSLVACVALVLCMGASQIMSLEASATVVKRATIESLTAQAELILHARVGAQWSPMQRGLKGEIYTYTRLTPIEVWSGQLKGSEALLVQLGGQLGEFRLEVHGDARLKEGQEVVLFLSLGEENKLPVSTAIELPDYRVTHLISLAQGAFFVDRSAHSGVPSVHQDLEGLVFYGPQSAQLKLGLTEVNHQPKLTLDLNTLKSRVMSALKTSITDGPSRETP